jgi:hypothetical protein
MFRLAAQSAMQSNTAIGAFIRRIKARLGAPTAINAGANKLARLFYRMLKFGEAYVEQGQTYSAAGRKACYFGDRTLEFRIPRRTRKRNHIPDIGYPRQEHQEPFETQTETGMGDRAKTTQIQVPPIIFLA